MLAPEIIMPKKKTEISHRFFYSKLLLFGEHTVNLGSEGIALPLKLFEGFFENKEILTGVEMASNQSLELLANYIIFHSKLSKFIDTNRLLSDIEDGLYFNSNIPQGYGLGSSGALAAAVLHNYGVGVNEKNFSALKEILADIESYYHGKSSGLDALVSFTNSSIYITKEKAEKVSTPTFNKMDLKFFLVDTRKVRSTSTFVNLFLKKTEDKNFSKQIEKLLVPVVNLCISYFVKNDTANLLKSFAILSQHQLNLMPEFIPESMKTLWQQGLKSKQFYLKICGAGGGGFILGICPQSVNPEDIFGKCLVLK